MVGRLVDCNAAHTETLQFILPASWAASSRRPRQDTYCCGLIAHYLSEEAARRDAASVARAIRHVFIIRTLTREILVLMKGSMNHRVDSLEATTRTSFSRQQRSGSTRAPHDRFDSQCRNGYPAAADDDTWPFMKRGESWRRGGRGALQQMFNRPRRMHGRGHRDYNTVSRFKPLYVCVISHI